MAEKTQCNLIAGMLPYDFGNALNCLRECPPSDGTLAINCANNVVGQRSLIRLPVAVLCVLAVVATGWAAEAPVDASHWASLLVGRGVNISCALEAPEEGKWGVLIREEHLDVIRDAGFNSIRLPVRWNAHAADGAPFAVEPAFLKRVDEVVGWALDRGLVVVLDWHHYTEFRETSSS